MKTLRDQVTEKIQVVFERELKYEGNYIFSVKNIKLVVPEELNQKELVSISSNFINISEDKKVEFLIKDEGNIRNRALKFEDAKYTFRVDETSDLMSIKLLLELPEKRFRSLLPIRYFLEHYFDENKNLYDLLKIIFRHYYSLTIENNVDNNTTNFEKLAKSGLFNISMSFGMNFSLVKNIEEEDRARTGRLHSKSTPNVPHLLYDDEMVQYYIAGNAARIPKVQFLSYYNVLEFCFDKIYNEEKCEEIQKIVTNPKFNYASLRSYKKIIDIFKVNKNKASEIEMLQSLIDRYIDAPDFRKFLADNDYYLNNIAHKINDTKFSLDDSDALLKKKLTKRIYKVRNAIVHSKESEEEKYFPQDEKYIMCEVDLVKYVSEQVIIGTAVILN